MTSLKTARATKRLLTCPRLLESNMRPWVRCAAVEKQCSHRASEKSSQRSWRRFTHPYMVCILQQARVAA